MAGILTLALPLRRHCLVVSRRSTLVQIVNTIRTLEMQHDLVNSQILKSAPYSDHTMSMLAEFPKPLFSANT